MSLLADLERMLADLNRQLEENGEDIARYNERLQELYRERIRIYDGIVGIEAEIKKQRKETEESD